MTFIQLLFSYDDSLVTHQQLVPPVKLKIESSTLSLSGEELEGIVNILIPEKFVNYKKIMDIKFTLLFTLEIISLHLNLSNKNI